MAFRISIGNVFHDRLLQYTTVFGNLAGRIVAEITPSCSHTDSEASKNLDDFVHGLGNQLNAEVWVEDQDGRLVSKSFHHVPPRSDGFVVHRNHNFIITRLEGNQKGILATIPVRTKTGAQCRLQIKLGRNKHGFPELIYAISILFIVIIIALLVFPVSRYISGPLNELAESARRIARGDLTHRTSVQSTDEIGELAYSFNHMAERIESMIRENQTLTANVSHELRSPLARLRLDFELMRDRMQENRDDRFTKNIVRMEQEIESMDRLIGRIMQLSKQTRKEAVDENTEDINIHDRLTKIVDREIEFFNKKHISVVVHPSLTNIHLHMNPDSFRAMADNLVENARKYTPENGSFEIDCVQTNDFIELSFSNTVANNISVGRLFEPFYRECDIREAGFGLGLAIVKEIVEKQEGTVHVTCEDRVIKFMIKFPS